MYTELRIGNNPINNVFSKMSLSIAGWFLAIYLLWHILVIGFRIDHFNFILVLTLLYFASSITRKMVISFIFFWIFWIIYDAMRIYPNFNFNDVHILGPYNLEKSLFGIQSPDGLLTPNEYLVKNTDSSSDLLSGLFYLTWVPLPMIYCIYLFFADKRMLLIFSSTFLLANIIGFTIYYIYPAAPPWYVALHGFEVDFSVPGNAAQLHRFDDIIGYPLFEKMYNKNANVFAAIPSLHSAYPVILLYFASKKKKWWLTLLCIVEVIGIWYAAVYSMHHYIIDVILGAFCAIIAIFVLGLLIKNKRIANFIDKFVTFIA
ncbi:MAG: membrane-associated phospholipid phosphatase [Saprospiraceae bacterium]|jgi:membrane-associated phospholipid phosphatase